MPLKKLSNLDNPIVRFEVFGPQHSQHLLASKAINEMWRWMPALPKGSGGPQYVEHVLKQKACGKMAPYALFDNRTGEFAGVAGFGDINPLHRNLRIAFAWHPERYTGTTFFATVQLVMIQQAFDWAARRLTWHLTPDNQGGLAAMEFLRAKREATMRDYMRTADGKWVDVIVYSMLREEMADTLSRLSSMMRTGR